MGKQPLPSNVAIVALGFVSFGGRNPCGSRSGWSFFLAFLLCLTVEGLLVLTACPPFISELNESLSFSSTLVILLSSYSHLVLHSKHPEGPKLFIIDLNLLLLPLLD